MLISQITTYSYIVWLLDCFTEHNELCQTVFWWIFSWKLQSTGVLVKSTQSCAIPPVVSAISVKSTYTLCIWSSTFLWLGICSHFLKEFLQDSHFVVVGHLLQKQHWIIHSHFLFLRHPQAVTAMCYSAWEVKKQFSCWTWLNSCWA